MKRILLIIAALFMSNMAAWFLLIATSPFVAFVMDPIRTNLSSALFMMFIMIYYGSVYILIGFLPFSIIASLLGLVLQRQSQKNCIGGGVLTGLGFYLSLTFCIGPEDGFVFILGPALGAVCGWIYWRIAIGRTPSNSHAIEAE